jgi:RNA polymerase sigma-70 factor (ECF subfamily)
MLAAATVDEPISMPAFPAEARLTAIDDPDIRTMERIRDGDQEAVVDLVGRFQDELIGFFFHLCWDQLISEELAQDVFVNVYRSRTRWVATAKVRTWVYRIAHNLWIDHLRRQRRHLSIDADGEGERPPLAEALAAPRSDDPEAADRDRVIRDRVARALADLPEGQRLVFVMANNQGLRYQEIAAVLGIPEGTVKSRMHNAVRALRDDLVDLVED